MQMFIDTESKVPVYLSVKEASKVTGLTVYTIRQRIENGSLPYICLSNRFYINMPALLSMLEEESVNNAKKRRES